jgi:hypothetical protein
MFVLADERVPVGTVEVMSTKEHKACASASVANPDLYVFGPPGSGSIRTRYGSRSGSGSFHHLVKIVRKTLIPTVLFCDFFITLYL